MEHVEVLERLRDRWAVPDERVALDAAIAALSAPQAPAEAEIETLRAALESLKAHMGNAVMSRDGIIKALSEARDEQGAEIHRLRAELEIAKGQAEFYRTERNAQQRKAERLEEAKAKVSALQAELDRLRGELRGEHVRVLRDRNAEAARAERLAEALHTLAAHVRPTCSVLWDEAQAALRDHDQEVGNG